MGSAASGRCFVTASAHWRCWPRCCWWSSEPTPTGLLPLFAIGVFIGFTISQVGLVRHWRVRRPPGWAGRAALNGVGATLTAVASVVFFLWKFAEAAWLLLLIVPALIWLFASQRYYRRAGQELGVVQIPAVPDPTVVASSVVIVPVVAGPRLAELALRTAARLGGQVIAVAVDLDHSSTAELQAQWARWNPGYDLLVVPSPHRILVGPSKSSSTPVPLQVTR